MGGTKVITDYKKERLKMWEALESLRVERKQKWEPRDGYTPEQCCALVVAVKGLRNELLLLAPKQTLRVLLRDGLIDYRCSVTRKGEDLFYQWVSQDRIKKAAEEKARRQ